MTEKECEGEFRRIFYAPLAAFVNNYIIFGITGYTGVYIITNIKLRELIGHTRTTYVLGWSLLVFAIIMMGWTIVILIDNIRDNMEHNRNNDLSNVQILIFSIAAAIPILSFIAFIPAFFYLSLK